MTSGGSVPTPTSIPFERIIGFSEKFVTNILFVMGGRAFTVPETGKTIRISIKSKRGVIWMSPMLLFMTEVVQPAGPASACILN